MTDNQPDSLEQSLKAATWWPDPPPNLWKRALSQSKSPVRKKRRVHRFLSSRWPWIGTPIAAVIVMAIILNNQQNTGEGRPFWELVADQRARVFVSPSSESTPAQEDNPQVHWNFDREPASFGRWNDKYGDSLGTDSRAYIKLNPDGSRTPVKNWFSPSAPGLARPRADSDGIGVPAATPSTAWSLAGADSAETSPSWKLSQVPQSQPGAAQAFTHRTAALGRHIIHRASIDLKADDVRGVYIKLQTLIPSPGEGEYVESAQIHTNNNITTAYVTLRIQPTRLGQVLSALRNLAEVTSEQTDASDVSTQVVDLEARLRNEKRVEQELLDLLEKRKDAPLEDILKVNDSLAQIRGRIEQMTAQQQTLARQVALASIVVTIRQKDAPPPAPVATSFASRLAAKIKSAWTAGLDFLASSVAAILQTIVGGLLFWIGLIVVLVLLRRWYLRRTT